MEPVRDPAPTEVPPATEGAPATDGIAPDGVTPDGITPADIAGVVAGAAGDAGVPAPPAAAGGLVEGEDAAPPELSIEGLIHDVERLTAERDGYLDRLQRAQAEFENSKKRLQRDAADRADQQANRLVEDLLPVLDACDAALAHGEVGVEPIFAALLQTLEKNGLERIDPRGDVFDPTRHEAVLHEPAGPDDDPALSLVVDVLRIGYAWKGRVIRAAMVKVRG